MQRSRASSKIQDPLSDVAALAYLQGSKAASLGNDRSAIEDRCHDAIEVVDDRGAVCKLQLLRNHCPAQAHPREACILAEGARLHAAILSP